MQFRLGKLMLKVQIGIYSIFFFLSGLFVRMRSGDLRILDIIPGVNQVGDVPFDRGAVDIEAVNALQFLRDLLLGHGMVRVGIPAQDLQDI